MKVATLTVDNFDEGIDYHLTNNAYFGENSFYLAIIQRIISIFLAQTGTTRNYGSERIYPLWQIIELKKVA